MPLRARAGTEPPSAARLDGGEHAQPHPMAAVPWMRATRLGRCPHTTDLGVTSSLQPSSACTPSSAECKGEAPEASVSVPVPLYLVQLAAKLAGYPGHPLFSGSEVLACCAPGAAGQ